MAFFSWWYGAGWRHQVTKMSDRLLGLTDTFSISLLLKTFFSPFRQISVGSVNGPLGVQLQAFFDKLISRIIGAFVRTAVIIAGSIVLAFFAIWAVLRISMWPFLPILPIVGVILWAIGWIPWI